MPLLSQAIQVDPSAGNGHDHKPAKIESPRRTDSRSTPESEETSGWWKRNGLTLTILLFAAFFAALAVHAHEKFLHPLEGTPINEIALFLSEFSREIAIGTVVGCVVALLFELNHWSRVVGEPLSKITGEIKTAHTDSLAATAHLIEQNQLLRMAARDGIIAIHARDAAMHLAIQSIVTGASGKVFVVGRAHAKMLGDGNNPDAAWLTESLLDRMELEQELEFKLLLGDAYTPDTPFRTRTEAREGHGRLRQGRNTLELLVSEIDKRDQKRRRLAPAAKPILTRLEIRLASSDLPYATVMSEERALVEHYLPSLSGGRTPILELHATAARGDSMPHNHSETIFRGYERDVRQQFAEATPAVDVLADWLARKRKVFQTDGAHSTSTVTPHGGSLVPSNFQSTLRCFEILSLLA
jgi:hypothetical protein